MKFFSLVIGLLGFVVVPGQAQQQLQLKFQLYQGESTILDALETRLLSGGTAAGEAMKKLPDFVRSRKIESIEELEITTISGQRAKGASAKKLLKVDDAGWELTDGLGVETNAIFTESTGIISVNLASEWARSEGRSVRITKLTTAVESRSGEPVLLQRWTVGDADRMLIMTATAPGANAAAGPPDKLIYFDTSVYQSEADAQAKRDRVARMIFPSRSGQRSRSEDFFALLFDVDGAGTIETANVGFNVEMDPALKSDGSVLDLNAAVEFSEERGGKERTADGTRIPRVEFRRAVAQVVLKSGEMKPVEMKKSSLGNSKAEPDEWRATFGFQLSQSGSAE